jgi:hypothetical protein
VDRPGERGRSLSTTDSSVASILSSSEKLIPDAYLPKDIQVLSQRRQRHGHHHLTSRSSYAHSSKHGSSRVSDSSLRGNGTVRVVRNQDDVPPPSMGKVYAFGVQTASSSFGYSDDGNGGSSRLSVQELLVK